MSVTRLAWITARLALVLDRSIGDDVELEQLQEYHCDVTFRPFFRCASNYLTHVSVSNRNFAATVRDMMFAKDSAYMCPQAVHLGELINVIMLLELSVPLLQHSSPSRFGVLYLAGQVKKCVLQMDRAREEFQELTASNCTKYDAVASI